jgi:hypothetical protein
LNNKKNICSNSEEIRMQRKKMGGAAAVILDWDEVFFKETFAETWHCIQAVTGFQKPLARFHAIAAALPVNQQIAGGSKMKAQYAMFQQDEGSVHHVCGCCGLEAGGSWCFHTRNDAASSSNMDRNVS